LARTKAKPRSRASAGRSRAAPILEVNQVSVAFGGLQALNGVTAQVREKEIVGLIGPNGAGKTTLFECISGFQAYGAGRIDYQGHDLSVL
jgi:branched-chain amino acid transport system ATP-binding protein